MKAPASMTVTFHFNVGKKLALLSMPFEKGEDSHETMKKFFHDEDIPVYLENPILGALENLFQEVIASSAEDLSATVGPEDAQKKAQQWAVYLKERAVSPNSTVELPADSEEDRVFTNAYGDIVRRGGPIRDMLLNMENDNAIQILAKSQAASKQLMALQVKQSEEIERASSPDSFDPEQVSKLVNKHVQEMEDLEKQCDMEISDLKQKQRVEYREAVINLSASLQDAKPEQHQGSTSQSAGDGGDGSGGESPSQQGDKDKGRKGTFMRRLKSKQDTEPMQKSASFLLGQPPPPPDSELVPGETFTTFLGGQMKILYSLKVLNQVSLLDLCIPSSPSPSAPGVSAYGSSVPSSQSLGPNFDKIRLKTSNSIYSDSLSAVVLLVDCEMSYKSKHASNFMEQCTATMDCHFSDVRTQIKNATAGLQKLGLGDFFLTTHSNLLATHVVFHLAVDKKSTSLQDPTLERSALLNGVRNILATASQYDISTITIPILLTETSFDAINSLPPGSSPINSGPTNAVDLCLKRAQSVLKCVKAFLMSNSLTDSSLKTIQFTLPAGADANFSKQIKGLLVDVFNIHS